MRLWHRDVAVILNLFAYLRDVLTINKDAAFLHIIKTKEQPYDGAFAGP